MGPSLVLTAMTKADAEFVARLAADERVTAFIGDGHTWSQEYTAQRVDHALSDAGICWYIARRQNSPVGLFTATDRPAAPEIGYWTDPALLGQVFAKALVGQRLARLQPRARN